MKPRGHLKGFPPDPREYRATLAELESMWGTEDLGGGVIVNALKAVLPQSGAGRWRVILIDARGIRTEGSDVAPFVAP